MADDETCILSDAGLKNKCDKSANQVFHLSLKAKIEDAKPPKELIMDEDPYKVSNRYNNIAKNVSVKASRRKVNLNGNIGSSVKTNKCVGVALLDESIESVSKEDRTQNDINSSEQVNDEQGSLETVRKRKTCVSPDGSSGQHNSSKFENMQNTSFKKRKVSRLSIPTQSFIPQADARVSKSNEDSSTVQRTVVNPLESQGSAVLDAVEPDTHLTGFAQYLGLQPIVKFRCFKCEETGFPSLNKLQEHQNACLKNLKVPLIPKPSQPHVSVDPSLSSTNFRISRKVFLCGSCGTYYENWNLFLHMREVHKRLICLYCLTMFSQIDMLSAHLTAKHGIVETIHASAEDLLSDCKGSCFLMCCDCDAIFTERDDFANHVCVEKPPAGTTCQLCGMRSTHFPTCPRAGANSSSTSTSSSCSFSQTTGGSTVTDSKISPQITTLERTSTGASVTKYLIPVSSVQVPHRKTTVKKSRVAENNQESDIDDDYDISNAASFCHVNIHEAPEKTSSVCSDVRTTDVCQKSIQIPCTSNTNTQDKLISDTVSSNTDSIHKSDSSLNKTNFLDKTSKLSSPVIEDSTSDNKPLEQKCDVSTSSDNNIKVHVGDSRHNEDRQENTSQQHDSAELSQPPGAVNINISPPTTVDSDDISHSEELGAYSSHVTSSLESEGNVRGPLAESVGSEEKQVPVTPETQTESEQEVFLHADNVDMSSDKKHENISINTDLVSAASETIETEVKLSTCNVSKSAAIPHVQHLENVEACDPTDVLETDGSDSKSPVIMNKMDLKSPVRIAEADIESSVKLDEVNVKAVEGTEVLDDLAAGDTFEDEAADTGKMDFHDTQSLTRTISFDSMSPLTDDTMDVKSPVETDMTDSNKSVRGEEVDSQSPKVEEDSFKSPTLDQIDLNLPETSDAFDSKTSPPAADGLDSDSSTQDEMFDKFLTSEIIGSNKSPSRTPFIDARSPEKSDTVDYKSPVRVGWSDSAKSPLLTELEDSSTSSLRIELNSSESVPSNERSKSPVQFSYSKSPLSGELNGSSRNSPIISQSPLPEIDASKSPLRTPLLTDFSRSSSRASSVENRSVSPSPLECPNTENSTDASYLGPTIVTETENDLQASVFEREYVSKTQISSSSLVDSESYMPTTSCTENILKSNTDIGIKLKITSGTPVVIPKAMYDDECDKDRELALPTPSPNNIGDINTLSKGEDDSLFSTLDMHKNNVSASTNKNNTKSKKKRPSRGGRRVIRRAARKGKKLSENISESENSGPVEVQDDPNIKAEETLEFLQLAGDDCMPMELHLEDDLEALTIQVVMQESVKLAHDTCVYCNHAKKIAVNGEQLALHLLAEHKFIPIYTKCESTDLSADDLPSKKPHEVSGEEPSTEEAEKLNLERKTLMDQYVQKLKIALPNLQDLFLNTDTYDSSDRTFSRPYDRTYECFHCHFVTVLHKDLYVHNRKMHQKTILLCIMCKSNFYSYSELLCHLCPGIYVPESSIKFRCHICSIDSLPSTFRLMVHLRKRHSVCDVCLETTDDQQKLSTHVWKHKLHHLCYRCGIAYRNKPDITKHLFWKHGTESVLCKKCLQKKWPHVYHFCIPPNAFICEECSASFTVAVALKVHKRLHTGDFPHSCDECEERFISKRLLEKHQEKHRQVPDEPNVTGEENTLNVSEDEKCKSPTMILNLTSETTLMNHLVSPSSGDPALPKETPTASSTTVMPQNQNASKPPEKKVDVYDLPPLNLSSDSDDSDAEELVKNKTTCSLDAVSTKLETVMQPVEEDTQQPVPIVDGIWDNFQNYKANLERRESQNSENMSNVPTLSSSVSGPTVLTNVMLDHDYCVADGEKVDPVTDAVVEPPSTCVSVLDPAEQRNGLTSLSEKTENENNGFDHDYCFNKTDGVGKDDEKRENGDKISCLDSSTNVGSSIKKQKSQKKKKRSASSSSSDSSSSSGSSSCSCGDNCSCSSSSSSSGSSSDSSDSDRSTSESRKRQIARKERREKIRRKREEGPFLQETPVINSAQEEHDDVNQVCPPAEPEEKEVPILESDLDTDETETDEDFYDQHPQLLANKLMAEKRNQLLLLAAVAPVNNVAPQPEPSSLAVPTETLSPQRKKVKSKKRKKRQHDVEKSSENKLKLNLSTNYYNYQSSNPDFYKPVVESHTFNPMQNFSQLSRLPPAPSIQNILEPVGVSSAAESGSETDSKRLSKRRRMPKKFYGDSSDEDSSSHTKWSRKPSAVSNPAPVSCPPPIPPSIYKNVNPLPEASRVDIQSTALAVSEKSEEEDGAETESEQGDVKKSSSESSSDTDGEKEMEIHTDSDIEPPLVVETEPVQVVKKNENVYCYCQCPYDEVSEMIACDGKDCKIEWFHFECVGIMVPPKGKWFCPDCKKRMPMKNQHLS